MINWIIFVLIVLLVIFLYRKSLKARSNTTPDIEDIVKEDHFWNNTD